MTDRRVVVLDLETTGLDPEQHEIIEVGLLVCEATPLLPIVGELCLKVRAEHPERADEKALEINGRTRESLSEGVPFEAALRWMRPQIEGQIIAGHNVSGFDLRFLRKGYGEEPWDHHVLDSNALAFPLWFHGELGSTSLRAICAHFGVVNLNPHTARADAYATREVLIHLLSEEVS